MNKRNLGQFFTPKETIEFMISLVKNNGNVLEPSCGEGRFLSYFDNILGIEIDDSFQSGKIINQDFFNFPITEKFDTIIGNPPYVKFKDILPSTKSKICNNKLFDKRTNLYCFFIEKCIHHLKDDGELIFIVPKDFLTATFSRKLNSFLHTQGTITDYYDVGENVFMDASVNCIVFRFEKNNLSYITNNTYKQICINGSLQFTKNEETIRFGDCFDVKVGAATGADDIFISEKGNEFFVDSSTFYTNKLVKVITNKEDLLPFKEKLISRKIKKFDESNWWKFGRDAPKKEGNRIYVLNYCRKENPFFVSECNNYLGGVLAIYPKFDCDIIEIKQWLNRLDWKELGFFSDGRYFFKQKVLTDLEIPKRLFNFTV